MNTAPIYIIGSERSGTNLLQTLISNHKNIDGPKSPHLMNTFFNHLRYFENLDDPLKGKILFDNLLSISNHDFTGWDINPRFSDFHSSKNLHFLEMISFLYKIKTTESGKPRYISKELNAHNHVESLLTINKNSKFIHLVRDPREQVASWMRTPLPFLNPYKAILHWIEIQDLILNKTALYPDNILLIKYEDLVMNTVSSIDKILDFIDEPRDENCYFTKPVKKDEESKKLKLWENLNKPVSNNLNKHVDILSNTYIRMIENFAESIMIELNYPHSTNKKWRNTLYFRLNLLFEDRKNARRKNYKGYDLIVERMNYAKSLKNKVKSDFLLQYGVN